MKKISENFKISIFMSFAIIIGFSIVFTFILISLIIDPNILSKLSNTRRIITILIDIIPPLY